MITSSVGGASLRDSVVTFTSIQARPSSRFTAKSAETSWCQLSRGASKTMIGAAFATPRKDPTTNPTTVNLFLNDFTVSISLEIDRSTSRASVLLNRVFRTFTVSVDAMCSAKERLRVLGAYSLRQSRDRRSVTSLGSIVGVAIATRRRLPVTQSTPLRWRPSDERRSFRNVDTMGVPQVLAIASTVYWKGSSVIATRHLHSWASAWVGSVN